MGNWVITKLPNYLIVGGYALGLHGHPRYTKDIDIWVERSQSNLERFHKVLTAFGIDLTGEGKTHFLEVNHFYYATSQTPRPEHHYRLPAHRP